MKASWKGWRSSPQRCQYSFCNQTSEYVCSAGPSCAASNAPLKEKHQLVVVKQGGDSKRHNMKYSHILPRCSEGQIPADLPGNPMVGQKLGAEWCALIQVSSRMAYTSSCWSRFQVTTLLTLNEVQPLCAG